MSFVDVDGVQIYYEVHGSGNGTPLILSHCLAGHSGLWKENIDALSQEQKLILWDCRGHGKSSVPTESHDYGITRSARDLARVLDAVGVDQAHVGGLSMGGGISACFAILFPERTASLMIMDSNTAAGLPSPPALRDARLEAIRLCATATSQSERDSLVRYFIDTNASYRIVSEGELVIPPAGHPLMDAVQGTTPIGLGHTLNCMQNSDFPIDRVRELSMPTLVLAGSQDPGMRAVQVTHERIAHSQLVTLDEAGHISNLDQPRAFERAVLGFLASTRG